MRKLTTEEFIERAKKVHGDKYDYSKVDYINAQTKVCIICPEHGEFWVKPYNFLGGGNCPRCIRHSWTTESFIEAAKKVHGDKYDYSKTEYKEVRKKVCIISHQKDRYGNEIGEFWQNPLDHLKGQGSPKEPRGIREDKWETRICPICGKEFKIRKKYEKITCSEECRKKYVEIHKDEINAKKSQSLRETNSKKPIEVKRAELAKARATCLKRYGVDMYSKTQESRQKSSEIMKKVKKKKDEEYRENVLIPKYREICNNDDLELLEFRSRFDCTVKCKKCGDIFVIRTLGYLKEENITNKCRICHPLEQITGPTKLENSFEEFLKEIKVKYYKNCRKIITPQEIDYYLPDYNIGFELDGLFWHCEEQKPDPEYHLKKTEKCLEKDVRLIHIFEDEWSYKPDICKNIIKNILNMNKTRIGARKCEVREVDKKECKQFIEENHIQGFIGFKYGFGLYYENKLVSVMTFGKLRRNLGYKNEDDTYEILRLCTKEGISVNGGASKMLKAFIDAYKPKKIITYCDRRWSNGDVYEKIGFNFVHNTKPNYFYVIKDTRKNRFAFRKNILVERYGCPVDMTEKEFCHQNHWYRIYDCGAKLYEMTFDEN